MNWSNRNRENGKRLASAAGTGQVNENRCLILRCCNCLLMFTLGFIV